MRFKLYKLEVKRSAGHVTGHIVAASDDHAAMVLLDHEEALGLKHEWFSLERVDHVLDEQQRNGLDTLLEGAPAGFASWCDIGWVAHAAAVNRLRLYRSEDHRGMEIFGVAPNAGVAAMLFANTQLPETMKTYLFNITDVTDSPPADPMGDLNAALETGSVGIAEFDEENGRWFVW